MTCPKCQNILSDDSAYCIFCGNVLTRKGKTAVRYEPGAKKYRRTGAAKAQRFFLLVALAFGLATFGAILLSPEIPWYVSSVLPTPTLTVSPEPTPTVSPEPTPTVTPEPTPTATPEPTPTATPEPTPTAIPEPTPTVSPAAEATEEPAPTPTPDESGAFYGRSGDYSVVMYLTVVESDDPDTQAAAEAIMGEPLDGIVSLDIDASGDGTMDIDNAYFPENFIRVSALVGSDGKVSTDMLYGLMYGDGYNLTVVCVFSDDSISGFFWLDDEETHIEFQFEQ